MSCAAISLRCHLSGGTIFRPFRYGFYPRGRAGFWQKILTGLCTLMFFYSFGCYLPTYPRSPAALPFPSNLSTLLRKPLLSGALSGSPHGKQGQKSGADLRKAPFLPPSAQDCGQKPKRISHRYRQLWAK